MVNIWVATIFTLFFAVIWLRFNDSLAKRGILSGPISRKIIHIGTGPIFVGCWLLFPDEPLSRFAASLIPLLISIQFALVGSGFIKDSAAIEAMSRLGDPHEILRGPLFYGIVFVVITLSYWKDKPDGIIALMILCGGDGLADIIGKKVNGKSLPWSSEKTWAGSAAMLLGGFIFSAGMIAIFNFFGQLKGTALDYLPGLFVISLISTVVESFPFKDIDNLTVPSVALVSCHFLLG